MELVDILVLGTSALVRVGSNPTEGIYFDFFGKKLVILKEKTRHLKKKFFFAVKKQKSK